YVVVAVSLLSLLLMYRVDRIVKRGAQMRDKRLSAEAIPLSVQDNGWRRPAAFESFYNKKKKRSNERLVFPKGFEPLSSEPESEILSIELRERGCKDIDLLTLIL